jgi:hypothetical protein
VPCQRLHVGVAELVQQLRRALDVGEEEGDCAGRELAHLHEGWRRSTAVPSALSASGQSARGAVRRVDYSANVSVVIDENCDLAELSFAEPRPDPKGAARGLVCASAPAAQPPRGLAQSDHAYEDQADDQHRRDQLLAFLGRGLGRKGYEGKQRHAARP